MTRVKVSKEVFDAMQEIIFLYGTEDYRKKIFEMKYEGNFNTKYYDFSVLDNYSTYELAEIAFEGCDLELSPEEKIENKLEELKDHSLTYQKIFSDGMNFVLDAYKLNKKGGQ